jgi:protein transport protein SEC23
MLARMAAKKA